MTEQKYNLEHIILMSIVELEAENEGGPRIHLDPFFQNYHITLRDSDFRLMIKSIKEKIKGCFNDQYISLKIVAKQVGHDESMVDLCVFGEKVSHVSTDKKPKVAVNR